MGACLTVVLFLTNLRFILLCSVNNSYFRHSHDLLLASLHADYSLLVNEEGLYMHVTRISIKHYTMAKTL